ncbi:MAG: alpha/beta fold hydrolase [Spirochaetota bacterium]
MPRIEVNKANLAYQVEGTGMETVVLLNGIAMTMTHWKPVVDRLLAAGYRVLLHDMRGQLLSDKPDGPYSLEQHASDLAGLMDALGIDSAHIAGTSYGAEAALCFARDYPGRCLSLMAIDGASECDEVLEAAVEAWKAAALSDPRVFYKTMIPWNYSAAYIASHRDFLTDREDRVASLPPDYFAAFGRLCDAFLAIDLTKDLSRISCPSLVLVGEADILKPPTYSLIIANGILASRYQEIPDAGHAVVIEQPEAVAEALIAFLAEAPVR